METVLALLSLLMCVAVLIYAAARWACVPGFISAKDKANEETRKGMELRLDLSAKLFDMAVVVLGVVWGLVLTEKVQIKLHRWQHLVLFLSSNALLLFSLFFHLLYKRRVSALLWSLGQQPDITSEHVDYLFQVQWLLFFSSLLTGLFTVVSVKLLAGG